jgi:RNA polymerase sigma-70 factor (ECF subfamily)
VTATDDAEGDRVLVERLIATGDAAAFRALYRRHTPALYATAVRLLADAQDAEDAVHDVWLRAADAFRAFAWRSALRSWLTGILVNRVREMRREPSLARLEDDMAGEEPAELPLGVDAADIERAVAALPPGYRAVLVLHDIDGYTHEEIAAMLEIQPGTSKSQLAHARRALRRTLAPHSEENWHARRKG